MKTGLIDFFKKTSKMRPADRVHSQTDPVGDARDIEPFDISLVNETVSEWLDAPKTSSSTLDRVLSVCLEEHVISTHDIDAWKETFKKKSGYSLPNQLTWREVVSIDPWRSQQFERMAARVYGFRSVLICQMSTLVLADMLTVRVLPSKWNEMFEMGLAPVVEHGHSPLVNNRIICISKDPSSRRTRDFVNGISSFQPELAYADGPVVSGMLEMISQHVPAIASAVYVSRPALQKVISTATPTKRAA